MKTKGTTLIMCFFGGGIGLHRFYLGDTGLGLLYLLTCWTFIPALVAFLELFYFLFMSDNEFNRKYNQGMLAYQPPVQQINIHNPNQINTNDLSNQLHQLHELHIKGILTTEEFEIQKRKLLKM